MKFYGLIMMSVTELVVTIIIFLFAGRWADNHFAGGNTYLISGTILGFILGMYRFYQRLKVVMIDNDNDSGPGQGS